MDSHTSKRHLSGRHGTGLDGDRREHTMFEICAKMPEGSGPVLGDYARCSSDNCEAAMAKGRV